MFENKRHLTLGLRRQIRAIYCLSSVCKFIALEFSILIDVGLEKAQSIIVSGNVIVLTKYLMLWTRFICSKNDMLSMLWNLYKLGSLLLNICQEYGLSMEDKVFAACNLVSLAKLSDLFAFFKETIMYICHAFCNTLEIVFCLSSPNSTSYNYWYDLIFCAL